MIIISCYDRGIVFLLVPLWVRPFCTACEPHVVFDFYFAEMIHCSMDIYTETRLYWSRSHWRGKKRRNPLYAFKNCTLSLPMGVLDSQGHWSRLPWMDNLKYLDLKLFIYLEIALNSEQLWSLISKMKVTYEKNIQNNTLLWVNLLQGQGHEIVYWFSTCLEYEKFTFLFAELPWV